MKIVIFWAVLAALVEVSQANTCKGIASCVTMMTRASQESDLDDLCREMRTALDCIDSSMADCANIGMEQSVIFTYREPVKFIRAKLDERCGGKRVN